MTPRPSILLLDSTQESQDAFVQGVRETAKDWFDPDTITAYVSIMDTEHLHLTIQGEDIAVPYGHTLMMDQPSEPTTWTTALMI